VPAPAVIPAPIVYMKVAAVKKLVVGIWIMIESTLPFKFKMVVWPKIIYQSLTYFDSSFLYGGNCYK